MLSALNLQHNSQVDVSYGEHFDSETYKLLEVDERLLAELIENGLSIKGGVDEEAVLCTSTATYAIKFVSTSNTVLLVPPGGHSTTILDGLGPQEISPKEQARVVATVTGHLELLETLPRVENLRTLLGRRPYKDDDEVEDEGHGDGDDYGDGGTVVEDGKNLYTWDDLLTLVQASVVQLRTALTAIQAVQIGKYWRIVDSDFLHNVLEILLLSAIQHDWPLDNLPGPEVIRILEADNYSPQIVIHCLQVFGTRADSGLQASPNSELLANHETDLTVQDTRWALDEMKVCLQFAKRLLATKEKWKLEDFVEAWQKLAPMGMTPNLQMLKGEALMEALGPETWVHPFSVSALPRKPEARFAALFQRRAKWEWEDLEPYLRDLKEPNRSVEAMLLRYTRKTQASAKSPLVFTAR